MSPEELELFRQNLIAQLATAGALGRKPAALKVGLRAGGFEPSDKQLDDNLDYLIGKGLVADVEKQISPAARRYKITAAGVDYAETNRLLA